MKVIDAYEVGELSRRTGITVRTLHHYDQIGLLIPSDRSLAGYRRYSREDVARLQRILLYRELGFSLDRIAALLSGQTVPVAELRRQRELIGDRIARLQAMVRVIDNELEAEQMGISLTPEEKFEVFGPDWSDDYAEEAEQRWGQTGAWQQSRARTAGYSKQQWEQIKAETGELETAFAQALADGVAANSTGALALAERHRQHLSRWFYDTPYSMHRCLGQLYIQDGRFSAYYDKIAPGLGEYISRAITANADQGERRA